jgi:hypothetical protein
VSIIIVSWNVRDCLSNCLKSVFATSSRISVEVFVIDNHSTDGSVEAVRREFPTVRLVENSVNVGFATANNQGIQQSSGEYVLLLNPDTLMLEGSLDRVLQVMESDAKVGVTGPKLLNEDGTIQYWCARALPRPRDSFFEYSKLSALFPRSRLFGRYLMGYWDHRDSREVECLSGACLFIRRRTLEEVGALDEGYPLYTEDTDWCHRVRDAGWKLYYCADAQVIHIGQQSSSQNRGRSTVSAVYGVYRYHRKFNGRWAAVSAWLLLSMTSIFKLIAWSALGVTRIAGRERAAEQVRAYWEVCKLWPRSPKTGDRTRSRLINS